MEPMANVKPVGRGGIGNAEEGEGRAEGLAAVAAKPCCLPKRNLNEPS